MLVFICFLCSLAQFLFQLDKVAVDLLVVEHLKQLVVELELAGAWITVHINVDLETVCSDLILLLV